MKRRMISMLLIVCMVMSLLPMQVFATNNESAAAPDEAPSNPFTDVKEGQWYYDAVLYAYKNGLFSGTGSGTFSPGGSITRAMYVTVLGRMAGVDLSQNSAAPEFSDVKADAYFAPYVAWAAEKGITSGIGGGQFNPDSLVTREQMATFIVRLFDSNGYTYPAATVTGAPRDIERVADYAKDAVLKLWACGLFAGDADGNFNPKSNASRAEAATFLMRTDKHLVEAGFKQPTDKKPDEKPEDNDDDGGTMTTYYKVEFALGTGVDGAGVALPEAKTYQKGTAITSLPTPFKQNGIFLGWYYDADMTRGAENSDKVTGNMTLYAKMAEGAVGLSEIDTPSYITAMDASTDFTFQVKADSVEDVRSALTIKNITSNNAVVNYMITGTGPYTIEPSLDAGQTYKAELMEDSEAVFVYFGEQPASVRILNFITAKAEVQNLSLDGEVKYIESSKVSNMTGSALDGLFTLSISGRSADTQENTSTGTFDYDGSEVVIAVGDTVAIYAGTQPNLRTAETDDGAVAYVTVTGKSGSTYTYSAAQSEDVLFIPDILPVSFGADKDPGDGDVLTADEAALDFTDDKYATMGLDSQTTIDVGDIIAFYSGISVESGGSLGYARITSVTLNSGIYTITYEPVSEDDVMAAMDIYQTREEEIELTEEQKRQIEADMERQAIASGFVEEAVAYLSSLALETDGFQELSDDMNLKRVEVQANGEPADGEIVSLMGLKDRVEITKKEVVATLAAGKVLQHFDGRSGVRAELELNFTFEITPVGGSDNKIEVTLQAIFEQEILLSMNVSGGAIWKWAWIFPYIYDYQINANFDIGTFTGIGITATAKTVGADSDEGFDWKPVTGNKHEEKIINIGKQITDLMEAKEEFLGEKLVDENGEEVEWSGSNGGGLAEKYAAMMENADDSWIELFRKEIFSVEGSVDPFHILVFGISADFVVSANLYVTLGMTFEYANAKRYNFSLKLFHKQSTNETIDLEEAHYQFDFYVMGTLGVRAGVEFEVAVGLFSLKLSSIGITAEAGAYAQLWGYFYYSLRWSQSQGKTSSYSGAMLIEIGIYLKITFKAQLFSSEKLTYRPTLLDKQWPLMTIGDQKNVYDFAAIDDSELNYDVKIVRSFTLPTALFDMQYMDMKSGEIGGEEGGDVPALSCDDAAESRFIISMSNPNFSYNPATNTVTMTAAETAVLETGEMTIIWKGGSLAFTSRPISRTIKLKWSNPANARYISFDSMGGSSARMISAAVGDSITWPQDPSKQGYRFTGWYIDSACTSPYSGSMTKMPEFGYSRGTTVYAGWAPTPNSYTAEYYRQELNGQYTKTESVVMNDDKTDANILTGSTADGHSTTAPTGYVYNSKKSTTNAVVAANGSTVVKVYFDLAKYTLTFSYGPGYTSEANPDVVYNNTQYGAAIFAPTMALGGYAFDGWTTAVPETMPAGDQTFTAKWKPDPSTPYRVEHYVKVPGGSSYVLPGGDDSVQSFSGMTGGVINLAELKLSTPGLTYQKATVGGVDVTRPTIGPDGKTVVKLYYSRNLYNLTVKVGDAVYSTTPVYYGTSLQAPTAPEVAGYDFLGWYADSALTTPYSFANQTMPAENLTVYAKMEAGAQTYTVRHFVMDTMGNYPANPTKAISGSGKTDEVLTLSQLVDSDLLVPGGIVYKEGKVGSGVMTTVTVPADGSLTVSLYYERIQYDLGWDFDGGTPDGAYTQAGLVYFDTPITAPTLSKTGYDYTWDIAPESKMPSQSVTYAAIWTARNDTAYKVEHYQQNANDNGYTLKETESLAGVTGAPVTATDKNYANFTINSGAAGSKPSGNIAADGTLVLKLYYDRASFTVTFDKNAADAVLTDAQTQTLRHGATVTTAAPIRMGYGFGGWHLEESCTNAFNGTMPAENITVYAKWNAGEVGYSVEHYVMDLSGCYQLSGAAESKTASTGTELTLAELVDSNKLVADAIVFKEAEVGDTVQTTATVLADGSLTVKLYYERKQYDLSWNLGEGTVTNESTYTKAGQVYYGTPIAAPVLTKTGYTYAWDSTPATTMPAANVSHTVSWIANTYTVRFNANGGTGTMADQPFTYDEAEKALSANTYSRTGYTFQGWASTAGGEKVYDDNWSVRNLTDIQSGIVTLYAVWAQVNYSITYHLDGGSNNASNPGSYTVTDAVTLLAPTKAGYTYNGWYDNAEQSGTPVTTIPKGSTGDKTYWASWTVENYAISYYLNGGTVSGINPTTYTSIDDAITLENPTRSHYSFKGWSGTGLTGDANLTVTIPAGSSGARSYTANWTPVQYAISYNLDGGTEPDPANPVSYTIESDTFTLSAPTRAGYTFTGWTGSNGAVPQTVVKINKGTVGVRKFTANWSKNAHSVTMYDRASNEVLGVITGTEKLPGVISGMVVTGWYAVQTGGSKVSYTVGTTTAEGITESALYADLLKKDGTTYLLDSEDDLLYVKNKMVTATGGDYETWRSGSYRLTGDISLTQSWISSFNEFSGTMNGNGYTLTLKTMTTPLFDQIKEGGKVTDLNVIATDEITKAPSVFGVIAGQNYGTIEGVGSGNTVEAKKMTLANMNDSTVYVGGIVGLNRGNINNYHYKGRVYVDTSSKGTNTLHLGGIAGQNYAATIENCSNDGFVSIFGLTGESSTAGGIAGSNAGSGSVTAQILNCTNTGYLGGVPYVGGITGKNESNAIVSGCENAGPVGSNYTTTGGGIVGVNYTTGTVTASRVLAGVTVKGARYAGGIAGYNYGTIGGTGEEEGCIFSGIVISEYNTTFGREQTLHAGGFAGWNDSSGKIINCSADGTKENMSSVEGTAAETVYVGGAAGTNKGVIQDCSVKNINVFARTYATAWSSTGAFAGFAAGYNSGTITGFTGSSDSDVESSVLGHRKNDYYSGDNPPPSIYLGGFVGKNDNSGTISDGAILPNCVLTYQFVDPASVAYYEGDFVGYAVSATEDCVSNCTTWNPTPPTIGNIPDSGK